MKNSLLYKQEVLVQANSLVPAILSVHPAQPSSIQRKRLINLLRFLGQLPNKPQPTLARCLVVSLCHDKAAVKPALVEILHRHGVFGPVLRHVDLGGNGYPEGEVYGQ